MGVKRGLDCKLYRNTATFGSPTWNEITKARDVTRTIEANEAEGGARDDDYEAMVRTRKKLSIEFEMVADPAIDDYDALVAALDADPGTVLDIAIADGAIATVGTRYLRADYQVFSMTESQPLDGVNMDQFTLKRTYSANPVTFTTVS